MTWSNLLKRYKTHKRQVIIILSHFTGGNRQNEKLSYLERWDSDPAVWLQSPPLAFSKCGPWPQTLILLRIFISLFSFLSLSASIFCLSFFLFLLKIVPYEFGKHFFKELTHINLLSLLLIHFFLCHLSVFFPFCSVNQHLCFFVNFLGH